MGADDFKISGGFLDLRVVVAEESVKKRGHLLPAWYRTWNSDRGVTDSSATDDRAVHWSSELTEGGGRIFHTPFLRPSDQGFIAASTLFRGSSQWIPLMGYIYIYIYWLPD
jgi:hypothetical protein